MAMSPPRPSWTRTPRGRSTSSPERTAARVARGLELHVEAALAGAVGGERLRARVATLIVRSAPIREAKASTPSATSVATISRAPWARAAMIASAPIGPQPLTSTRLSSSEPARATACRVTAKGSASAASPIEMPSATLWHCAGERDEPLAEGALDVRERHGAAVEAHVQALVRQALEAVRAGAAGPARRDRDPVADREALDAFPECDDPPGDLVAEDHRLAQPHGAEAAVVEVVQVGAADAAGLDRDLDLAGAGGLGLALLDAEILRGMDDDGAHGPLLRRRG